MKYIRVIEDSEEYITTKENLHDHILALQDSGFDFEGGIIKEADTIRELIMKGDLIFYKDSYSGLNAKEYPSIAYNDIDKCSQYFEKEITKIFIEDTNGNFIKVSELDDRHNLKIV